MADKWVQERKDISNHVAIVNINTKEILALAVTDEKVHDGKMIKKLVKHVLNNNDTTTARRRRNKILHSFIGVGAYDLIRISNS